MNRNFYILIVIIITRFYHSLHQRNYNRLETIVYFRKKRFYESTTSLLETNQTETN